jgi:hypothetical protein
MAVKHIGAHEAGWRSSKHARQWQATLDTYCAPLKDLPIDQIDTKAVLACLEPAYGGGLPSRRQHPRDRGRGIALAALVEMALRLKLGGDVPPRYWRSCNQQDCDRRPRTPQAFRVHSGCPAYQGTGRVE